MTATDTAPIVRSDDSLLKPATAHWIALAMLLLGIAARLRQYFDGRALWLDEVSLAINVVNRSFAELREPLDHFQVAPIGFLWATKAVVTVMGPTELAFRLLPLLAGIGTLVVFFLLLRRVTGPVGLVVGMCLVACMPQLVYYSNEFKQYALALFGVTVVLWLAMRVMERPDVSWRWVTLFVVGLALQWFSHAVIFALGGAALVLLFEQVRAGRWRGACGAMAMGLVWAGQFALSYVLFYRSTGESEGMRAYWDGGFMPQALSISTIEWFIGAWYTLLHSSPRGGANGLYLWELKGLWGFFIFVGIIGLLMRRPRTMLWLLLAPIGFLFLAAVVRMYPIADRLVLFVATIRYGLAAAGGGLVIDLLAQRSRCGGRVVLAGVLLFPTLAGVYLTLKPMGMEESRDLFAALAPKVEEGQVVYLEANVRNAYTFYAERTGLTGVPTIQGIFTGARHELIHEEADRIAQYPAVWVVTTHRYDRNDISDVALLDLELSLRGESVARLDTWGCVATLYHFEPEKAPDTGESNHE